MTSRRKFLFASATALAAPVGLRTTDVDAQSNQLPVTPKAAVSPPAPVLPPKGTIILDDTASGVARDSYHAVLGIPWRGSFQGSLLGSKVATGATTVRIPLSSAQEMLVLRSRNTWASIYTREAGRPPTLEVTYTDGSAAILPCQADAAVDPSTALPIGYATYISLSTAVAVLRFAPPAKPVASATLAFQTISTGGAATFEAYQFISPILPEPSPVYGLRARGLSGPTLIEATNFGAPNWWRPWFTDMSMPPSAQMAANALVDVDLDTMVPLGRKAYLIETRPAGQVPYFAFPEAPTYIFPNNIGKELEEVYFQYRLRFGQGWRGGSMQSGKLPGIASNTTFAGNGGATSNGKNGWSFRGLFVGEPLAPTSPYNSNNGIVPIGWYTYNPDQIAARTFYGLHLPWTGRGSLGLIEVGKDYWIDQYVKVNTPGKRDGIVRAWINGQLAYERTDHIMRDFPPYMVPGNLAINKVWMTFLHGGDIYPLPTKTLRTYWSDWTIATEYIGPPKAATATPPSVNIVSPVEGTTLPAGASIALSVSAVPGSNAITKIDFYRDGALVGSDLAAPYNVTVSGSPAGRHTLMAVATDSANNVAFSTPVNVTVGSLVNTPPTVTISAPTNNSVFKAGSTVGVRTYVTDTDGTVSKVQFLLNNRVFSSFMGGRSPYSASLGGLLPGSYTLQVVATDNQGANTSTTAKFTVTA